MEVMNINQVFAFANKSVRIYGTNENPYFCGKDVAEILEYKNARDAIKTHVRDKNKKLLCDLLDILGVVNRDSYNYNELQAICLSEAGLYELIFSSKMEKAIAFKDKVFEEVLPI